MAGTNDGMVGMRAHSALPTSLLPLWPCYVKWENAFVISTVAHSLGRKTIPVYDRIGLEKCLYFPHFPSHILVLFFF